MIRTQDFIDKNLLGKAFQLLQIHDELLFEVKKSDVEFFIKGIKKILEEIYTGEVILKVEAKIGKNWGEMKKYAILE